MDVVSYLAFMAHGMQLLGVLVYRKCRHCRLRASITCHIPVPLGRRAIVPQNLVKREKLTLADTRPHQFQIPVIQCCVIARTQSSGLASTREKACGAVLRIGIVIKKSRKVKVVFRELDLLSARNWDDESRNNASVSSNSRRQEKGEKSGQPKELPRALIVILERMRSDFSGSATWRDQNPTSQTAARRYRVSITDATEIKVRYEKLLESKVGRPHIELRLRWLRWSPDSGIRTAIECYQLNRIGTLSAIL
jgi:hypothetical protein